MIFDGRNFYTSHQDLMTELLLQRHGLTSLSFETTDFGRTLRFNIERFSFLGHRTVYVETDIHRLCTAESWLDVIDQQVLGAAARLGEWLDDMIMAAMLARLPVLRVEEHQLPRCGTRYAVVLVGGYVFAEKTIGVSYKSKREVG